MLVKLRPYNLREEVSIEVSKSALVQFLLDEARKAYATTDSQDLDLVFRGQFLTSETPLLIYQLKENDVIGVRIRNKQLSPVKSQKDTSQDESDEDTEEVKEDKLKYFEPGDNLYYEDLQTGHWREASLVSVVKDSGENASPNLGEDVFLYTVYDGELNEEITVPLLSVRPCGHTELTVTDLLPDMEILAFCEPHYSKPGWYRVLVTSVKNGRVNGTICMKADKMITNALVTYCYRTILFPKLIPRMEWKKLGCYQSLVKPCSSCKSHPTQKCRDCSCVECGGKHEDDKQLICEECEDAYHMACLNPPVHEIPDGEWFCPDCVHVDEKLEQKVKESTKKKIDKANESIKIIENGRDWGKGLGTAAVTDKFCVVPRDHLGKIPGVPSGRLWASRVDVCRYGVHRPPVAGLCGSVNNGLESVCFSGGYEGDYDNGFEFVMSGSGGRDLSENRRINKQSSSQTLTSTNLAMAQSCYAEINDEVGATSADWRRGLPVRVVRGYKLSRISKFAPKEGYRYDGIYKVVKYFKATNNDNVMWKFHFRRDDSEPAPWTSAGIAFTRDMSVGFLEGLKTKSKDAEQENKPKAAPRKRKWSSIEEAEPAVPRKITPYPIKPKFQRLIDLDTSNQRNWNIVKESVHLGYPDFIKCVAEQFKCSICQDVAKDPFTPNCGHNTCLECVQKWMRKSDNNQCPFCHAEIVTPVLVNRNLNWILKQYLPGYNNKNPPKPFHLVPK